MNKYLLSGLCLLAMNNSADAQPLTLPTGTITAQANDDETVSLNTPTTAGSRLNLTALETPASVESLTGEQIRARGDRSVQDAVSRSTGISRTGTPGDGGTSLSARGFTGQSSVMQLYDGNRMYTGMGTVTFPVDTWSVERVDVLRGPASVLYGEGATGAVVNVIPKKPFEGEIENHVRLGYGSYDSQQQAFDSGGSLSDTLSYRLNLNRLRSNGWVDRGDSSSDFISAALRWQATDDLAFTLAHDYGDQKPMNYFGTPLINGRFTESLRDKNYNVSNDKQHYNDQWTRLTSDWQISEHRQFQQRAVLPQGSTPLAERRELQLRPQHSAAQPQRLLRHRPQAGTGRRPSDLHLQTLAVRPRQPDRDRRRLQPYSLPARQQLAVQ